MLKGLLYEVRKINLWKYIIALVVLVIVGNIGISLLYHQDEFSHKAAMEAEKNNYQEAYDSIGNNDELGVARICEQEIAIINYSIQHHIPYKRLTVLGNLAMNKYLINLVVLILAICSYDLVAVENENNTWKNIIVATHNNIKQIFVRKKIVEWIVILEGLCIFLFLAIMFGVVRYSDWTNVTVTYLNGQIITGSYNQQIVSMIIKTFVKGLVYADLSFLLACRFKKSRIVLIFVIILIFFDDTIVKLLQDLSFERFFPFKHLFILENIYDYKLIDICVAITYFISMILAFSFFSYQAIKKVTVS
ncbi:MAG: hypothetical protein PUC75_01720 [Lachnospiraceae bacterium]|nr:hypothetical protein [Lachnospiraceae bacterium]MDD6448707.1 hypothetical protein [Lachnospiraceae bacterium]MDD6451918.1 hypothetical protein [Lachnospiraceae bacterium]MDD6578632.1 hypothetical protein [Lachnospiraceae bacterium]